MPMKKILLLCAGAVAVLALFLAGIGQVASSAGAEGLAQLETALRQAAVACYASEGIYPPNVSYLQDHYGVQIDEERYIVDYSIFADNLMPDITVLERDS